MAPITSFEAPVSLARRFPHITMKRYLTCLAILCIFYFLQWPSTEELMGRDRYTSRQEKVKINMSKLSSPTQLYVAFSVKRWDDGELADEGGGRFPPNLVTTVATNARTSKGIHRTIFCLLSNFSTSKLRRIRGPLHKQIVATCRIHAVFAIRFTCTLP